MQLFFALGLPISFVLLAHYLSQGAYWQFSQQLPYVSRLPFTPMTAREVPLLVIDAQDARPL